MVDPTAGMPRHGDITGDPEPGHRVSLIWAAVVIYANGDEGLCSSYTFNDEGVPVGRITYVGSDLMMVALMKEMTAQVTPPPGGRIEWREYRQVGVSDRQGTL